jgi:glucosylglycerate phosphorylase
MFSAQMTDVFHDDLLALYGETTALEVQPQLADLLTRWRSQLTLSASPPPESASQLGLSERDALLITYADQLRAPDQSPLRALHHFAQAHLRDVVSGIHLLPFYPWSSDDGFSVKDYYAVDPAAGSWDDIQQLRAGFDLMFDAVFNHLSAQSDWFAKFLQGDEAYRDFFVTVAGNPDLSAVIRPRALPLLTEFPTSEGPKKVWTTFSADQVDVNIRNPRVLLALLDVLLFYVSRGARFIRLDAIAFLWKEIGTTSLHRPQTHRVIQLMRRVLEELAPRTLLITETNVPHVDNVSYFGDGTNEAHLVYNFALPPLVLHTFATGNSTALTRWAQTLKLPSDRVAFFNFLASHDGIGVNPARGILTQAEIDALVARTLQHGGFISYKHLPDGSQVPYEMNINFFDALSSPTSPEPIAIQIARTQCAHAIQLALAGLPGIYFHSLFGSRGDRRGAEASGIPRRINREKLTLAALERDLADPISLRGRIFAGLRALLEVRRSSPAFHPSATQEIIADDPRLFIVRRTSLDGRESVMCIHNVSAASVETRLKYRHLVRTATERRIFRVLFGAEDSVIRNALFLRVSIAPYAVAWVRLGSI